MAKAEPKLVRLRHYTRISSMKRIVEEEIILARDRNRVFVERATRKPLSPREVEDEYLLRAGKGNAYVEFDGQSEEIEQHQNPETGELELSIWGDVDLSWRNAEGFLNR